MAKVTLPSDGRRGVRPVGEGTASNLDAGRIRLSDLAWETLGPDVQVSTDHPRVKFRVTVGGKSAEIVATAALS